MPLCGGPGRLRWVAPFSLAQETWLGRVLVSVSSLFCSLIQRPPAIKTGSLYCPLSTLVSCVPLCRLSGALYSGVVYDGRTRGRERGRCFASLVFCSLLKCLRVNSDSSVKKEAHSICHPCFVSSHKDTGVLLSRVC